ncbi:NAD(P)H-hydrate dehydratase [Ferruginibacter albus]|uniref:NAD(P)H-hydrate dehydratase n=1 Tax=Ferruginibacter albus TaxID=2875540 RepID=UPI001CC742AD|nr:NAD(P)H-hydrate dehydratase [Ferruginibacter albus]UAY53363.1 NAD(P)H-hydrate dehydratase [Ferruginibacter albus]
MKIFSANQIKEWDNYTIAQEPIASIDLMERAGGKCVEWLLNNYPTSSSFIIFCGSGNNGGDGLVIARKLQESTAKVKVYILPGEKRSNDFTINLERLTAIHPQFISAKETFPEISKKDIVIDALFGTGLNKPLQGLAAELVQHINQSNVTIISIDVPGGLFADASSVNNTVMCAAHTLTFQISKLAFFMAENGNYTGNVHVLDIGLDNNYYQQTASPYATIDNKQIATIYQPRRKFSHKYNYGHALLYVGSTNMMGAAILCTKACLRSGAGLVTVHCIETTKASINITIPEAITTTDNTPDVWNKKNVIAIGPGLEITEQNKQLVQDILLNYSGGLVIDATALTILAEFPELLSKRKRAAILTPHTGEFEKLFGKTNNNFEQLELAVKKASALNCYIVLKGHYSFVVTPTQKVFINTTGNPGMATAGSGDVFTGIITGLLAQNYSEENACILGVYLHGLAGDVAADALSEESMIAGDIIQHLSFAYKKIKTAI